MRGVTYYNRARRWRADFYGNGERVYLGLFGSEEEAEERLLKAKKIAAPHLSPTRKDNKTGHRGIHFSKSDNKYRARLKGKHIGMFATLTEAVTAQSKAKRAEHHKATN